MVDELIKEKVLRDQEAVAGQKVWRRRLPEDDGYEFRAAKRRPGKDWNPASPSQVLCIALRALNGY